MRLFSYRLSSRRTSEYLATCNETCAAEGNVIFNHAMFLNSGDAKYLDVADLSPFNNTLATSPGGDALFYFNPLEAEGSSKDNHATARRANGPPAPAFHQTYPVFANVGLSACCIAQDALDALDAQNVQPQLRQQP